MKRPAAIKEDAAMPQKRAKRSTADPTLDTVQAALNVVPNEGVKMLYDLMNTREEIRKRRETGAHSKHLYDNLNSNFTEYLMKHRCNNVRRCHDRTTRGLHSFCAAQRRFADCRTEAAKKDMKKLFVLNFGIWRVIAGTVAFAGELGFCSNWSSVEKQRIRGLLTHAFKEQRIEALLTNAYKSPGKPRAILLSTKADHNTLRKVLFNTGPKKVESKLVLQETLPGKFRIIDELWDVADAVVDAAAPDNGGKTSMEKVAEVLKDVVYFGTTEGQQRVPGFFSKELIQDLLDTPVFEGGRRHVKDLYSYSPTGPGALAGLKMVYGLERQVKLQEALPMMQALLTFQHLWAHDGALELHDIQFMLNHKDGQRWAKMDNVSRCIYRLMMF